MIVHDDSLPLGSGSTTSSDRSPRRYGKGASPLLSRTLPWESMRMTVSLGLSTSETNPIRRPGSSTNLARASACSYFRSLVMANWISPNWVDFTL